MKYSIGQNLRKVRNEFGYSQDYLSKKLSISQSVYSKLESNQDSITLKMLNKIGEIFDKNPLELIQINNEPVINSYNNTQQQIENEISVKEIGPKIYDSLVKISDTMDRIIKNYY